ncbi:MAG: undecaprenyl/decaprenyl-phosphate alpha-N-acetylglucosaminyl 1-phosphate transferase [Flavobacteriales bacterium]|nr:undecaprenyl/decaprenyl-phosphate alpha-N-acetylglucosaminyl 1-phosphate transferase [Flavobacteriales bacterium]
MRDRDETMIRWSATTKPSLGGINFYIIFLLSGLFYSIFFDANTVWHNKEILGLLSATCIAFLMGLSDDAYNTRPFLKLVIQIMCGVLLIVSGIYIQVFDNESLNYCITLVWVIGIMNSLNMLDNMDAITTVVSSFIIAAALVIAAFNGEIFDVYPVFLIGVLGSLLGFLFFNWHPSKMFMGDTGSQFLGLLLAATGIKYFWNYGGELAGVTQPLTIVVLAFLLPIIDTTTVTLNRMLRKQSPFIGGKDHTTHHLSYLGLTDRQVAYIFIGISLISLSLITVMVSGLIEWNLIYFVSFSLYGLLSFGFLYSVTLIKSKKQNEEKQNSKEKTAETKPIKTKDNVIETQKAS